MANVNPECAVVLSLSNLFNDPLVREELKNDHVKNCDLCRLYDKFYSTKEESLIWVEDISSQKHK